MPFTVLKISKTNDEVEVMGEFGTEVEANAFLLGIRTEEGSESENEYLIEAPPTPPSPPSRKED